jgi:hypothetical protein
VVHQFCKDLITSIVGPGINDGTRFNQSSLQLNTYLHHFPAGTSSQEMAHYAQVESEKMVLVSNPI